MFRRPTVIVLGAGSSNEAKLPVGSELRTTIATLLRTREDDFGYRIPEDSEIYSALQNASQEEGVSPGNFIQAAQSMADAMPLSLSIDNYLEAHQEERAKITIGKIAIAKAILDAESASLLASQEEWQDSIDFSRAGQSWFTRFMQASTEGVSAANLDNVFQDISIINFNYDRCVEHFVRHALQVYYDLDDQRAIDLANRLYVFHPYGSVGVLPWQNEGAGIKYGSRKRGSGLLRIARSIKTFSERVEEGTELHDMRVRVANAEQIIFLGFAFHRQNLNLMNPGYVSEPKSVYGTALGISGSDQQVLREQIPQCLSPVPSDISINLSGTSCSGLIEEYWRTFTA